MPTHEDFPWLRDEQARQRRHPVPPRSSPEPWRDWDGGPPARRDSTHRGPTRVRAARGLSRELRRGEIAWTLVLTALFLAFKYAAALGWL